MDPVISVEHVSKQYRLGAVGSGTIKDDLKRWWHRTTGREDPFITVGEVNDKATRATGNYVWALRDISFEVQRGEVLGIIGRNGAGKSTMLKILSRVAEPTTGRITIKGRVASLLEVGTGMHPELTGRENVYLNGAILGMNRREIDRKFDEIVAFSGVERFIDTPIKRYSSGMHVRLGFAVAAHLEPEILIVDEVLAVGDADFQKRCLGKMKDVSEKDGRAVIFVSHNVGAIQRLCTSCLLLHNGTFQFKADPRSAIDHYSSSLSLAIYEFKDWSKSNAQIMRAWCEGITKRPSNEIGIGEDWKIVVEFRINMDLNDFVCAAGIVDISNTPINTTWTLPRAISSGIYRAEFQNSTIRFAAGKYFINIGLSNGKEVLEYIENAFGFDLIANTNELDPSIKILDAHSGYVLNPMNSEIYEI